MTALDRLKNLIKAASPLLARQKVDVLVICLCIIAALIFADSPKPLQTKTIKDYPASNAPVKEKKDVLKHAKTVDAPIESQYPYLEGRNLFTEDGRYTTASALKQIPLNPYNLMGILRGADRRVVIKDYKGETHSLKVGDKIRDEAQVIAIEDTSVKLKTDNGSMELKLFRVKPR